MNMQRARDEAEMVMSGCLDDVKEIIYIFIFIFDSSLKELE